MQNRVIGVFVYPYGLALFNWTIVWSLSKVTQYHQLQRKLFLFLSVARGGLINDVNSFFRCYRFFSRHSCPLIESSSSPLGRRTIHPNDTIAKKFFVVAVEFQRPNPAIRATSCYEDPTSRAAPI